MVNKSDLMCINIIISYSEVYKIAELNWGDILYAIENNFFEAGVVITHAEKILEQGSLDDTVLKLAVLNKNDYESSEVKNLILDLVKREKKFTQNYYYHKWVYIITSLIYENRSSYAEPLKVIEEFYDNFGYPSEISEIIRYMPSNESVPGDKEYNDALLYRNWIKYLKDNERKYSSI